MFQENCSRPTLSAPKTLLVIHCPHRCDPICSLIQLGIERRITSMYSLTFCVCIMSMSPERHHWKPAVQAASVMLRTPPSTASHRPASHAHFHIRRAILRTPAVTRRSPASSARAPRRAFTLCRHIAGWTQACN